MTPSWFVFGPDDGEVRHLRPPARSGAVTIMVDPKNTGSQRLAMGHQRLGPGSVIPVHLHERQDEILFVHAGQATLILEDQRVPAAEGTTVFVPEGVWHGVVNAGDGILHLLWIITPPGLEEMFRGISAPPGAERRPMTADEFTDLARRHGMHVRPQGT
ncbi:MAG TPA: cupin domain-containing protein [bacterium]|nr:cupin domain-containing protein [bacterium]